MSSLSRTLSRRVSCRKDSISDALSIVGLRQAFGLGLCEFVESVPCCGSALPFDGLDVSTDLAPECMAESSNLQHQRVRVIGQHKWAKS